MTFEELKNTLLTSHDEGVDSSAAYDSILTEVSEMYTKMNESERKVEDLTNRVAQLTDSNFKLLEKVRYMEPEESKEPEPEPEEITIEKLFEEG